MAASPNDNIGGPQSQIRRRGVTMDRYTTRCAPARWRAAVAGLAILTGLVPAAVHAQGRGFPGQPPSAPPGFSRLNLVGNLYVDVEGTYPEGYSGRWSGVGAPTTVPVSQIWYVNNGEARSMIQQPAFLAAPDSPDRAEFGFTVRGTTCYGDLAAGGGPILLSEAPRTFRVVNLHTVSPIPTSGCMVTNTLNSFNATVTLSANSRGDVSAQYVIDVFTARGLPQYRWESAQYQLKNAMTPTVAATDLTRKRQAAASQAAAEAVQAQAAAEQASKDQKDRNESDSILNSLSAARGRK